MQTAEPAVVVPAPVAVAMTSYRPPLSANAAVLAEMFKNDLFSVAVAISPSPHWRGRP